MSKDKIYIAYGSNLNLPQMAQRCPTAKVLGGTEINGYELLFRGSKTGAYATIEPCEGKSVPVLLWTVGKKDELALDRYEGYPTFYEKENRTVEVDGHSVDAFVYVMTEGHHLGMPSQYYVDVIAEGYRSAGFDLNILQEAINQTAQRMTEEPEQQSMFGFGGMKWR
ncbi:gamma-glutamylcyclotransferase family protein [Butyricicoccus sp. Marseille-Q5471]|uniref:gamma-glutamylcyclotransferase family protein n=1 Tax=Butyricicoccus sp. Marseille-Q5471 TaxID=3039493 RepID=UPI0024BC1CD0|nr:gamma-glutamylcyclotransferase family protein [Butyricicoccus sp. Marseille-Q5471]